MPLTSFHTKLKTYLRRSGYSQKELAHQLGWQPAFLSNKLNGYNYAILTLAEVKQIVLILAQWQAITTTQEAAELLAEMGLATNSFSTQEWSQPPLRGLTQNQALTLTYHSESISGTPASSKAVLAPSQPLPLPSAPLQAPPASGFGPFSQHSHYPATSTHSLPPPQTLLSSSPPHLSEESSRGPAQIRMLYGRQRELARLEQAVCVQRVRLVSLTGLGGSGKSALALKFAQNVENNFELVLWYSLWNAPPLHTLLAYFLNMLQAVGQPERLPILPVTTGEVERHLERLLACLQQVRCLIILDNFETVLASGQGGRSYLSGYEGYGRLLELVGHQPHQSCVVLTSREKPHQLALLEKLYTQRVLNLNLRGLNVESGRQLLEEEAKTQGSPVRGSEAEWEQLIGYYSGNPLALKLLVEPLQMLFGGNLKDFLAEGWGVVGDLEYLFNQQLERLSSLEQEILYWLAVERQPLSLSELKADFRATVSSKALGEGLISLRRRSLIEDSELAGYFGLQPVIMEYLTERLIEQVLQELNQAKVGDFLTNYALLKAETKDYIRQSQRKLILQPILARLGRRREEVNVRLWKLLARVKARSLEEQGYEAGNLINLLVELKAELQGADFSGLRVWQAYLHGVCLERVSLAGADLRGSLFSQAFGAVNGVAFSPDGRTLASGGFEGKVRLWEVATGQCLAMFEGHSNIVWSVAFSPDGKLVASGSADQTIRLWEVGSGQSLKILKGHNGEIISVAFSPDGKTLASGSYDSTVRLWDSATGQHLATFEGHTDQILAVAFSLNGKMMASSSLDNTIRLWEVANGQCLKTLQAHSNWVYSVAFSPDGRFLASGSDDQTIKLWEVASGQCLKSWQGHTDQVHAVAFSPDGKLVVSGSSDQTIRLWEVASDQCLATLQGHLSAIQTLAFSPDGKLLASGSHDQSIRLWEIENGLCLRMFEGYGNWISAAAYSPDGHYFASGSDDNIVRLWESASGQLLKTLQGHTSFVKSVAFSPDGKVLASGSSDQTIRLWNIANGKCFRILQACPSHKPNQIWRLVFSPDGERLANNDNDRQVYVWEVATGQCLKILKANASFGGKVISFSPDSQLLANGSQDHTIGLWEVNSGKCLRRLEGHTDEVLVVAFSPDGQVLASGSADHSIRLWDITSGRCFKVLEGHANWVFVLGFSPDGRYLVSSGFDRRLVVWDTITWHYLYDLEGHSGIVKTPTFKPGSSLMMGGDENYLRVWDLDSGELVQVVKNPGLYEGLNLLGVKGLSAMQEAGLVALGAVRNTSSPIDQPSQSRQERLK
jgi:WD40 repeat protein